jgi:beta-glucosidase
VGLTLALPDLQAEPGGEAHLAQALAETQDRWLDITGDDDFVGVQTYTRELFGPQGRLPPPEGDALTLTGWEVYPQALGRSVARAWTHTGKPILVTENGIATGHDPLRADYTRRALEGLGQARSAGAEVWGYLHWSALDNFEWMHGYGPTFGLIGVDRATQSRQVRDSARWLGDFARAHPDGP